MINNAIANTELTNTTGNGSAGHGYQAGIYDSGVNDKLINNDISGVGYNPNKCVFNTTPIETCATDASTAAKAKVHANTFDP